MVVLLLPLICVMPIVQYGNVLVIATASYPASFTATIVAIASYLNPTVSVVAPVAADTAFYNTFDIATLIANCTGADVTLVGNIIVQNNPTFSAAMSASVAVTHSE